MKSERTPARSGRDAVGAWLVPGLVCGLVAACTSAGGGGGYYVPVQGADGVTAADAPDAGAADDLGDTIADAVADAVADTDGADTGAPPLDTTSDLTPGDGAAPDTAGADAPADTAAEDAVSAACQTHKDCAGKYCLPSVGACVACLLDKHCPAGQKCHAQQCQAPVACQSDKQCATLGAVCDTVSATCVACKTTDDCKDGLACKAGQCALGYAQCLSSTDCAANDQVCVQQGSWASCEDCGTDADCESGLACIDGVCTVAPPECVAGVSGCQGDQLTVCGASGKWQVVGCAAGHACVVQDGSASCQPQNTNAACCAAKGAECGFTAGCSASCGGCPSGEQCVQNQCLSCCEKQGAQCGFVAGCSTSCGGCPSGQTCKANKCQTAPKLKKFGEACGPDATCPPPPVGASTAQLEAYWACLDSTCETGSCSYSVCTKLDCTYDQDQVINASGAFGIDGVQDPGLPDGCGGAVAGPWGTSFRCVEMASPQQIAAGDSFPICLPGTTLQACTADAQCPAGEVCTTAYILGKWTSRCRPAKKNPDAQPGALQGEACNENPFDGAVKSCQTGHCTMAGYCLALCASDADCVLGPAACVNGQCPGTGASCNALTPCKWTCMSAQIYTGVTMNACWY